MNIQDFLLKSFASEQSDTAELAEVVKMYSEDLDSFKIKGQLLLLPQTAESMGFDTSEFDVSDLVIFSRSLDSSRNKTIKRNFVLWESCYSSCQQPMPLVKDRFQL